MTILRIFTIYNILGNCVVKMHFVFWPCGCLWLLLLLLCELKYLAFQIPNVDFQISKESGFQVSILDEEGIKGVLYILQVDDTCPGLIDYITQPSKSGYWTTEQNWRLQNNDKVLINILVQYNDEIFEKSETRVILNTQLLTTRTNGTRNIYSKVNNEQQCQAYLNGKQSRNINRCKPSQTIGLRGQHICQGDLLFEENFDTSQVNRSTWAYDIRHRLYQAQEELVAFDDNSQNSYVREGQLYIVPTIADDVLKGNFQLGDRCTAIENPKRECNIPQGFQYIKPPVYSALLHTRNSFSFKYGKIVVRAKLPKGDWLFPYIMLQPFSTYTETQYAKQLRIAYARGNIYLRDIKQEDISGNHLYGGMIIWHKGRAVEFLKDRLSERHYGDDFHNYTLIWQPNKITLMVNDDTYGEIYDELSLFNEKCFIILGVTVGGFLNFDDSILPEDVKPYINGVPRAALNFWQNRNTWASTWSNNSAMIIDFVHVYAL